MKDFAEKIIDLVNQAQEDNAKIYNICVNPEDLENFIQYLTGISNVRPKDPYLFCGYPLVGSNDLAKGEIAVLSFKVFKLS